MTARTCAAGQLRIAVVRPLFGLRHAGGYIGFTNASRLPCSLRGWPTVVALASNGTATAARRSRSTWFGPPRMTARPRTVTLAPGERADAVFAGTDDPYLSPTRTCMPVIRHFRVVPPGSSSGRVISAYNAGLGRYLPACQRLEVSAVLRAAALWRG